MTLTKRQNKILKFMEQGLTKRQREILKLVEQGWKLRWKPKRPNIGFCLFAPSQIFANPVQGVNRRTLQPLFDAKLLTDPRLAVEGNPKGKRLDFLLRTVERTGEVTLCRESDTSYLVDNGEYLIGGGCTVEAALDDGTRREKP